MKTLRWLPALILCLFIFHQSSLSSTASSGLSLRITEWIYPAFAWIEKQTFHFLIRKAAHFSEFFMLGLSLLWPLKESSHRFLYFVLCICIPVCDEAIQYFTPGRAAMITDCMIDASGMLCAWLSGSILKPKEGKYNEHLEP